jgi:hypothetical protein
MTDPHQEAIERVAAWENISPAAVAVGSTKYRGQLYFAEQTVIAERKLEEASARLEEVIRLLQRLHLGLIS